MAEAFDRFAGIDLLATVGADGATDRDALAAGAPRRGHPRRRRRHLGRRLQPGAGGEDRAAPRPRPRRRSSANTRSARRRWRGPSPRDPRVAERFELYACGVELANCLRRTHRPGRAAPPLRGRDGGEGSASTASAIRSTRTSWPRWRRCRRPAARRSGFDRLVMLATGAAHIEQVLWTPVARSRCPLRRIAACAHDRQDPAHARRRWPTPAWSRPSGCRRWSGSRRATPWRSPRPWPTLIDAADPHDPIARQFVPDRGRARRRARGARRPDRRRRPQPGRGHRPPLSRPGAAEARTTPAPSTAASASAARWSGRTGRGRCRRRRWTPPWPTSPRGPTIWEVILTGGDPLVLSPRRLARR